MEDIYNFKDAFKSLESLEEDAFSVDKNGVQKLKDYLDSDEEDTSISVIDADAETEEELKKSYVGKVILDCNVCHSKIYKDKDEIQIEEDEESANIGEECPYCYSVDGYKIVGEVAEYCDDCEEKEEKDEVEVKETEETEEEEKVDESKKKNESCHKKTKRRLKESAGIDVIQDLIDRAELIVDEGKDADDAVREAIDEGLIYSEDIIALGLHYGVIDDSQIIDDIYESLFNDMYKDVSDYAEDKADETDESLTEAKNGKFVGQYDRVLNDGEIDGFVRLIKKVAGANGFDTSKVSVNIDNNVETPFPYGGASIKVTLPIKGGLEKRRASNKDTVSGITKITFKLYGQDGYADYDNHRDQLAKGKGKFDDDGNIKSDFDAKQYSVYISTDGTVKPYRKHYTYKYEGDNHYAYNEAIDDFEEDLQRYFDGFKAYTGIKESCKPVKEDLSYGELVSISQEWEKFKKDTGRSDAGSAREFIEKNFGKAYNDEEKEDIFGYISTLEEELKKKPVKEDFKDVTITTDDTHMEMTSDENGKVTVTTEPIKKEEREDSENIVVPVSDEAEKEIEDNQEDEVDVDFDEFDEESFDELGESYLKRVYGNVSSFNTSKVTADDTKVMVEGVIKFESGKEKRTSFVFESKNLLKGNRVRFIGENLQITRGKKAFNLTGSISDKKFVAESFNYNYKQKDNNGNSKRVYGTVFKKK